MPNKTDNGEIKKNSRPSKMNLSCDKIFTTLPQTLVVAYINPMSKLMDMVIQPSPSSSYMFYKLSNDKDKESSRDILFFCMTNHAISSSFWKIFDREKRNASSSSSCL